MHEGTFLSPQAPAGFLALSDGTVFPGHLFGARKDISAELVFTTAMTGYQETLSDPSYLGQIVTFATAHVGNTGANLMDDESEGAGPLGLVTGMRSPAYSNHRAHQSLDIYLTTRAIVGIENVDTRRLVRALRDLGATGAAIAQTKQRAQQLAAHAPLTLGKDMAGDASTTAPYTWSDALQSATDQNPSVAPDADPATMPLCAVVDFGVKRAILRHLRTIGFRVVVLPSDASAADVTSSGAAALVLSNGPGDPQASPARIAQVKTLLDLKLPTLGICLGHQLMALALGGATIRLPFGHHGINHPVRQHAGGPVAITSQNHLYAVDGKRLPTGSRVSETSLFDGSIQGLRYDDYPALSVQSHPEAHPGPTERDTVFAEFFQLVTA